MAEKYVIHPAIGVARVGNAGNNTPDCTTSHPPNDHDFFLAPNEIGGLPIEPNERGAITDFKNTCGLIKRQGQKFCIYQYDDVTGTSKKLVLQGTIKNNENEMEVASIKWTVSLANKKSVWYNYSELEGNLLLGENNSYLRQNVTKRSPDESEREKLIINPGPKEIAGSNEWVEISGGSFPRPADFPEMAQNPIQGKLFTKLGDLKTDDQGNLIVLGGHGDSWGLIDLEGYGGGDYWFDDTSDGPITCEITLLQNSGSITNEHTAKAWVIVGPPDFAPEIVNISSWDDTAFDVAVRELNLVPEMYNRDQWPNNDGWNPGCVVSYERDILPIIQRMSGYHWVANVQSMMAFSSNIFDFSDPSDENQEKRREYFSYFRKPETKTVLETPPVNSAPSVQTTLFSNESEEFIYTGIPLMPLNSGSNSVSNTSIKKFLALTETQYFLLEQWSKGFFTSSNPKSVLQLTVSQYPLIDQDRSSIGNVVGLPQCPGIEVTWTTQNKNIYMIENVVTKRNGGQEINPLSQIQINHSPPGRLFEDPMRDETEDDNKSCEPGDLTKRMAVPWQADFYNCSIQLVNYTDPNVNKVPDVDEQLVPKPPTYYNYWWPPQAPWHVINGLNVIASIDVDEAVAIQEYSCETEMAGLQMNFARGINSYSQMVNGGWSSLGYVRNINRSKLFPYFVETERNYDEFTYSPKSLSEEDEDGDEADFIITSLKPQKSLQNCRISANQEQSRWLRRAKKQGWKTFPVAGETGEISIDSYKKSLLQSLKALKSFRKINVVRKPGEVPRCGRRIRF